MKDPVCLDVDVHLKAAFHPILVMFLGDISIALISTVIISCQAPFRLLPSINTRTKEREATWSPGLKVLGESIF